MDDSPLDQPIWNSLTTGHAHLALGAGVGDSLARRYPPAIGPLAALREPSEEAYAELGSLTPQNDIVALLLPAEAAPPPGWQMLRGALVTQMLCPTPPAPYPASETIVALTSVDFPEMLALATLTEPGPFRDQTGSLGGFLGIRVGGRLAAMAGRRLAPTGFCEVSAVCSHPDFRGRGFAQALVTAVARNLHDEGITPFLTSLAANTRANRIYEQAGFSHRRTFHIVFLKPSPRS